MSESLCVHFRFTGILAGSILMGLVACATPNTTLNQRLSAREISCQDTIRVTNEETTRDGFHRWVAKCQSQRYICSYRESVDAVCSRVESKDVEEETVYLRGDDD